MYLVSDGWEIPRALAAPESVPLSMIAATYRMDLKSLLSIKYYSFY
jgi:hypothetical protein